MSLGIYTGKCEKTGLYYAFVICAYLLSIERCFD